MILLPCPHCGRLSDVVIEQKIYSIYNGDTGQFRDIVTEQETPACMNCEKDRDDILLDEKLGQIVKR